MNKITNNELALTIDLIIDEFDIYNPIIIAEKLKEFFDLDIKISTIEDYLSLYEPEKFKIEVENNYYNYVY